MAAGEYNWTIEQGATNARTFTYKDANNAAINLTGYTARMQVRPFKDSNDILIEATTVNGKLVITPLAGQITLTLAPSDTNTISFAAGVYDLEIESGSGVVTRLLEGAVTFNKQVTR